MSSGHAPGRRMRIVWLVVGLLVAGCARKPPPALEAPAARVTLTRFSGTPLSGPQGRVTAVGAPVQAPAISVRVLALAQMPTDLKPVGPEVRLIAGAAAGGEPVLATARLTREARWADGAEAEGFEAAQGGRAAAIGQQQAAVPPGSTWIVEAAGPGDGSAGRRVQFVVHAVPAGGAVELAVAVEAAGRRELAVLRAQDGTTGRTFVLAVPFDFADSPAKAVAAVIQVAPGSADPAHAEAVTQALAELKQSADAVGQRQALSAAAVKWAGFETALIDLADPAARRKALAYLAGQTGADVCLDVALVGDDPVLEQLTQQLAPAVGDATVPRTAAALGWLLDCTSLQVLVQQQSAGNMPAELLAVLLRHVGQPARAGTLEDLLKQADSREALTRRLLVENFVHLEDSAPAARVRAFDWLSARNRAPAGYDPLGPPRQRREALEKALPADAGGKP